MSSNPVSKTHIDALVYATFTWIEDAANLPYMTPERVAKRRSLWSDASKFGQNLWLLNIQRTTAGWEDEGDEEAADRSLLMQQVRDYQFEPFSGTPQLADLLVLIDYWRYQTVSDEDEDPEGHAVMKSIERARPHVACRLPPGSRTAVRAGRFNPPVGVGRR